jgi:Calcineurin-like phosphoesterase
MSGPTGLEDRLRLRSGAQKRAERERLGFLRQSSVRWLSPGLLAKSGIEVALSAAFGKFADKRELQTDEQSFFDLTGAGGGDPAGGLWLDFLADTGDGWEAAQTMAWLLAQPSLPLGEDETLPRADALLLGGDQVYPTAGAEPYEDRFVGPFAAACPVGEKPRPLFAIPGNHDWYDGLISFLRVFCRPDSIDTKEIGSWKTRQTRSYWALRLPSRWWVWAIDIQFDNYIDNRQLDYFTEVGEKLKPGDKVILITAKPSWVKVKGRFDPPSWRHLAYFERTMIAAHEAKLVLTLTGDLHHYSRYEPSEGGAGPVRITAGGGGAYLSATHTLPDALELPPAAGEPAEPYERAEIYPSASVSRRLRWGVLALPWTTPSFGALMGGVYALLGATVLAVLNARPAGLLDAATSGGLLRFVDYATGGTTVVVFVLLLALLCGYANFKSPPAKLAAGVAHGLIHIAIAMLVVYLLATAFSSLAGLAFWALALAACFLAGFALGSTVFAAYLLAVHVLRGERAPLHTNEVFASQAIADHKNFLRLHLDADGRLTVHALGVERICRRWDLSETGEGPKFAPRGEPPRAIRIDEPRTFDPPE